MNRFYDVICFLENGSFSKRMNSIAANYSFESFFIFTIDFKSGRSFILDMFI